VTRDLFAIAI